MYAGSKTLSIYISFKQDWVLELVYIKAQNQSCANKKSSFSHLDSSSKQL